MKKRGQVDEVVNPLTALGKLKSAYQTYKYGTTLPKEIEAIKQARLDTELKKAQVKLAKQGKLPAAADDAAAAAEVKPKGVLGKAADVVKYPFQNKLKTAAGATAAATGYEYLKDPDAPIGTLVARGVQDVGDVAGKALGWAAEKGAKFAGDFAKGFDEPDAKTTDVAKTDKTTSTKQPEAARPTEPEDTDIVVPPGPYPWKDVPGLHGFEPGTKFKRDELYEKSLSRLLEKYKRFLNEQKIDLELEKHFPDPNVRKAIGAKVGRESGGRNIGELDWTKTANKNIKTSFPQLKNLDDGQLNKLKAQGNQAFLDYAYRDIGGYQYRGRGPIQITGKANYARLDKDLGLKGALVKDPDLLLKDPQISKAATIQYLKNAGLDKYQAKDAKDAAQRVIHAIGGKQYAPGTKLGTRELAAVEKIIPTLGATGIAITAADQAKPTQTTASAAVVSPDTKLAGADTKLSPDTKLAGADTKVGSVANITTTDIKEPVAPTYTKLINVPAGKKFQDVFDIDAYTQSADTKDLTKFMKTPTAAKPTAPSLSEADQQTINWDRASKDYYDMREKKIGKTASQLASASQGQFATRADRLDQAKVDAALGPGFKAGSREANLALLQKFRGQQPQPVQPTQPDQSGQGGRPSPTPSPAVPAVRGAENLTPYTTAADVTGTAGLAAAAGQFLPKVGGVVAKAVPGLNVAYQGADALRRASLGDTTGSAISAAGAVPVLGIPAIAAQAVRDKYRTGSFFPSDEELKTAVDRDKGVAPTPAATPAPQAATPKLKEGNKMNKKQLKKRLEKLEETKSQVLQGMHDRAVSEGKFDAAARFAKMLRGLGGGAEALPASTIRKGGQTFDKVRGVDSELKYVNRASPTDIKSLDDIKNIGSKPPAVWRKGGDAGAATTASKAAGAADDVAAAAAKGGKPLSRTASTLAGAAGGALIGYGLGKMGGDDKPQPTPDPTPVPPGPDPAPRPTPPKPPKPTPGKDDPWDLRPVKPSVDDTPGSEYWLRRRVNQPTTTDTTKPTDDAKDLADRYGDDSYVSQAMKEDLDDIKWLAGLAKK